MAVKLDDPAQVQARALAASIDAAADDLRVHGPVSADEMRQLLTRIEAEWAADAADPALPGQPTRPHQR